MLNKVADKKRKKILHVISSLKVGGAERVLINLCTHLAPWYDQEVMYIHDGPMRQELAHLNILAKQISYSRCIKQFSTHYNHSKPNVIMSHLWAANILTRTLGKYYATPVINCMHAMPRHEGFIRNTLDRIWPFKAQHIIAVSPSIAHRLEKKLRLKKDALSVIPNGIDRAILDKESCKPIPQEALLFLRKKQQSKACIIGSVGRLAPVKNYPLLLASFKELLEKNYNCALVIIGSGPEKKHLEKYIKKHNIAEHVKIISEQKSYPYYRYFDCFVQASHSEGLSMALLEALYLGIPIITTGHNKKHDVIVHNRHGVIIPPKNQTALAQALIDIIKNYHLRTQLRISGKDLVEKRYTVRRMVELYKSCIEKLT